MRLRIALGAGLLLTLGTAVASMYGRAQTQALPSYESDAAVVVQPQVSPETIAIWKATAASTDYLAPKLPI